MIFVLVKWLFGFFAPDTFATWTSLLTPLSETGLTAFHHTPI